MSQRKCPVCGYPIRKQDLKDAFHALVPKHQGIHNMIVEGADADIVKCAVCNYLMLFEHGAIEGMISELDRLSENPEK